MPIWLALAQDVPARLAKLQPPSEQGGALNSRNYASVVPAVPAVLRSVGHDVAVSWVRLGMQCRGDGSKYALLMVHRPVAAEHRGEGAVVWGGCGLSIISQACERLGGPGSSAVSLPQSVWDQARVHGILHDLQLGPWRSTVEVSLSGSRLFLRELASKASHGDRRSMSDNAIQPGPIGPSPPGDRSEGDADGAHTAGRESPELPAVSRVRDPLSPSRTLALPVISGSSDLGPSGLHDAHAVLNRADSLAAVLLLWLEVSADALSETLGREENAPFPVDTQPKHEGLCCCCS
jgi:hypothetical protein